ncbi:MAG: NAD(P)-binding domain-containing protein [Pseudomonadota bacterium]
MNITIIGAGKMSSALVKQLTHAGHKVSITSRSSEKADALAASYAGATSVAAVNSVENADAIILASGYADAVNALKSVGNLTGKVVIDITNPLTADYMGLTIGHTTSAAEEIAKAIPEAEVVKAFNTLFAQVIANGADFGGGQTASVFVASDSERAKQMASVIAQSMGFVVLDAGGLKNARYLEPIAGFNIYLGYGAGKGTAIAPTWIQSTH